MSQLMQLTGLIILIIIAGVVDVGRQCKRLLNARQQAQVMQAAMEMRGRSSEVSLQQKIKFINPDVVFESFLTQIKMSGLILQSVDSTKISNKKTLTIHAEINGSFVQVMNFFAGMERACFPFAVDHFDLNQIKNSDLIFSLQLSLLPMCEKTNKHLFKPYNGPDPFALLDEQVRSELSLFPVKQMRLAGYMQMPKEIIAIVVLPDGDSFEVRVGDKLGREKAFVARVDKKEMVVWDGHQNVSMRYWI